MNLLRKRNQPPLGAYHGHKMYAAGLLGQMVFKENSKWWTKIHTRVTRLPQVKVM